ncbi:uncharacterized protein LOC144579753 isoform X2 [Callithrix jacchus]
MHWETDSTGTESSAPDPPSPRSFQEGRSGTSLSAPETEGYFPNPLHPVTLGHRRKHSKSLQSQPPRHGTVCQNPHLPPLSPPADSWGETDVSLTFMTPAALTQLILVICRPLCLHTVLRVCSAAQPRCLVQSKTPLSFTSWPKRLYVMLECPKYLLYFNNASSHHHLKCFGRCCDLESTVEM